MTPVIRRRIPLRFSMPMGVVLVVALCGCGDQQGEAPSDIPSTVQVRGIVLQANGQPLPGGEVEFHSDKNSDLTVMGTVGSDGKFSLRTNSSSGRSEGAPEGTYRVTVMPQMAQGAGNDIQAVPEPITVPGKFTVKASDDNDFTIKLP